MLYPLTFDSIIKRNDYCENKSNKAFSGQWFGAQNSLGTQKSLKITVRTLTLILYKINLVDSPSQCQNSGIGIKTSIQF